MKIIAWNVNGIRACLKKGFKDFLDNEKPDMLCLQEIKISKAAIVKEEFDFPGFNEYYFSAVKPGYSGTGILVSKKWKIVSYKEGLDSEKFDNEGRTQTIEFDDFYLVNNYFPNTQDELKRLDYKEEYNEVFFNHIKKLNKIKPVIACGDFNVAHEPIDLKHPKANEGRAGYSNQERVWMTKFIKAGFFDTFRSLYPEKVEYSWCSYRFNARANNAGWRIDYFLVSDKLKSSLKDACILGKVHGSDHAPIGIDIEIN
ncbi:MAG: exodeoxyribonuclease III [Candidatus Falkowbacteria bacterium]|nr:exodeoxyribonuclease III [Candidatus Falkowbacteria bacterium]